MQPEPFNSHAQAQPFSDSTALPAQNAPIASPIGAPPVSSAPSVSPEAGVGDGVPDATDAFAGLVKAHSSGANWFFWIVGLSLVNAALIAFGSEKVMAIGTNATLVMDYIMKEEIAASPAAAAVLRGIELAFDAVVLGFYAFCGVMAVRGKTWAFYLGMTAFALDTVISVVSADVIGGLLHAWALFSMWQGVAALKKIHAIHKAAQAPASPWAA